MEEEGCEPGRETQGSAAYVEQWQEVRYGLTLGWPGLLD